MQLSTAQLPNFLRQLCLSPWAVVLSAFGSSFVVVSGGEGLSTASLLSAVVLQPLGSCFVLLRQLFLTPWAVAFLSAVVFHPLGSCFVLLRQLFLTHWAVVLSDFGSCFLWFRQLLYLNEAAVYVQILQCDSNFTAKNITPVVLCLFGCCFILDRRFMF